MKKIAKIVFKGFLIIILFIGVIVAIYILTYYWKKQQNKQELIECCKACDANKIVDKQLEIGFSGFKYKEINILKFEIKRGENIFKDTIIKNKFSYVSDDKLYRKMLIPFSDFLKTDTIIVTMTNDLKFYVSDFHHSASFNYGMFGPVGEPICGLNSNFNINGRNWDCISRDLSLLESERHNRIKIVSATDSIEIAAVSKKSKITYTMANKIFDDNRMNKVWSSQINAGIHIEKNGTFYIFEEEREDQNGKIDIITIDAANGKYKRYSDFPFK